MNTNSARAGQYAQAIMDAMVDRWQEALSTVSAALQENPQTANMLADQSVSVAERVAALDSILPANVPFELSNTLKVMVQDGNLGLVDELGDALAQVGTDTAGPIKAEVTSAVELSEEDQEKLRSSLKARYGDNLVFTFHVNPTLMGGLRVRVGDRLIDTSVASRLQAMRESFASVVR
ncbi:MAG: ATP synthase F1 subunit delta [Caldilineaceae bacterium]